MGDGTGKGKRKRGETEKEEEEEEGEGQIRRETTNFSYRLFLSFLSTEGDDLLFIGLLHW